MWCCSHRWHGDRVHATGPFIVTIHVGCDWTGLNGLFPGSGGGHRSRCWSQQQHHLCQQLGSGERLFFLRNHHHNHRWVETRTGCFAFFFFYPEAVLCTWSCVSRFWKHLPQDRRGAAVLHLLRAGWDPHVWNLAGWSRRPPGYRSEETGGQNRNSLPGQSPTFAFRPSQWDPIYIHLCLTFLAEMASEPDLRASDLGPPVHLAGLPTLRCSADPGFPRGGEVDSPGVCLFCSYHPDHSGVWRLCRRYPPSVHLFPRFLLTDVTESCWSQSQQSLGDTPWTGRTPVPHTLTLWNRFVSDGSLPG